jgi:ribose transport system permease protein
VWGTLAGVLIFGVLATAFNQLGVNPYMKNVFQGIIIILAVASYTVRSKKEVS